MKKAVSSIILLLCLWPVFGQLDSLAVQINDEKYFEDQFYVGVYYNALLDQPTDIGQSKLSYGVHGGVIKDLPLNKSRTVALGLGAGLAYQSINTELRARKLSNGSIVYNPVAPGLTYRRNTISFASAELPVELRWRASSPTKYKFWRVYAGFKFNYVMEARSGFVTQDVKEGFKNDDVNSWLYGTYLTFGYNTWNFYIYYQLNTLFEDGVSTASEEPIDSRSLQVGLMFYVL